MGHSGGLPTMDRCGPAPPAAVKSPRAWLGATTPVQRERTSPAARLQPYHGLQALAGDPQAARPFPTARPSPLPGSNQPELELALRWGRTPFCERVSAGLLTAQHPALLPAAAIDPLATGQRSSSGSMLCSPGGQWQRLAPGLPEQPKAQAERHGTAWQPSQGSGRSVPLLRAGQLSHQLLPSPFKAAQLRGTMLADRSSVVQGGVQTHGRNTVPFPDYPAGYEHGKRLQEDADSCKGRVQGNRQTLLRPAGRDLGTSRGSPHTSLATGTLGLPPHLTDHFDLHGNKYFFNLSRNSVTTADFWGNKISI